MAGDRELIDDNEKTTALVFLLKTENGFICVTTPSTHEGSDLQEIPGYLSEKIKLGEVGVESGEKLNYDTIKNKVSEEATRLSILRRALSEELLLKSEEIEQITSAGEIIGESISKSKNYILVAVELDFLSELINEINKRIQNENERRNFVGEKVEVLRVEEMSLHDLQERFREVNTRNEIVSQKVIDFEKAIMKFYDDGELHNELSQCS